VFVKSNSLPGENGPYDDAVKNCRAIYLEIVRGDAVRYPASNVSKTASRGA